KMEIHEAYREVGSYRGAAEICGVDPKTVKRVVEGIEAPPAERKAHNYEAVRELVAAKLKKTAGKMSAKRLLPLARAEGYDGSPRNFRRLVAEERKKWRTTRATGRRPGVWAPGDVLAFDWGEEGALFVFCAVLCWSRVRFVYFADNCGAEATLNALAACFEYLGGVPKVALTDRMPCLRADTVAGLVVPTPDYVRFASHYRFRPDFCLAADPESKGIVENCVGYAKSDLIVPEELADKAVACANEARLAWLDEVNSRRHSEICAVPLERLEKERPLLGELPSLRPLIGKMTLRKVNKLSCIRFGSGRYSVPDEHVGRQVQVLVRDKTVEIVFLGEIVASHDLVAPGEASIKDEHYGGARKAPNRGVRPKTKEEKGFLALGEAAEVFVKQAAASGATKLASDLRELVALESVYGKEVLLAAIERAVEFNRFRAADVRSIIDAGQAAHRPVQPGSAVILGMPAVSTRSLSAYATKELS
ncbi:MAG TPA: IS21 family transposase, partial [Acidimicrobiales bacterium]|nr:IS21 family transposase [Acidimicrobiales bacterium]